MTALMRHIVLGGVIFIVTAQVCLGELISDMNILSFSLSGLAQDGDNPGSYGCCDKGNTASNCTDLCDPYFQICVGRWDNTSRNPCTGAFYVTSSKRNVNTYSGFPPTYRSRPIRSLSVSTLLLLPIEIYIRIMDRDDDVFDSDDVIDTFHWLSLDDYPDLTNRSWRIQNFTANNNSISTRVRLYKNCTSAGDTRCRTTCSVPDAYRDNIECVGGISGLPVCQTGWRGDTCRDDINECNETAPCQNNATCSNNVPGYACDCLPGWEGSNCEYDIDECSALLPCQNDGMCYNKIPGYRCDCDFGWRGDNCTDDIDECIAISPCENGGTCYNEIPGYRCHCDFGWTGDTCIDDIDECSTTSPCQNGGTCYNGMPGYRCDCDFGWLGDNCMERNLAITEPTLPNILETTRPSHGRFTNASSPAPCHFHEVIFLHKGSSSFGRTAFASSKGYIQTLVQTGVFMAEIKVGFLVYGHNIEQVKDVSEYHDKESLSEAVTSIRFPSSGGYTRVDLALRRSSVMWSIKSSTRLIVVFTDGVEAEIASTNLNIVKDENLENVGVVAVGIRDNNGYLSLSGLQAISVKTITRNWVDELRALFADTFGDCD